MRAVVQRVSEASVSVAGEPVGSIGRGLLILLGVARADTEDDAEWLVRKLASLRLFADAAGHMAHTLKEAGGEALVVSQFTLLASTAKGTKPSFSEAEKPELAVEIYEGFIADFEAESGVRVATGRFGAMMSVSLVNDGPVTLILDSRVRE